MYINKMIFEEEENITELIEKYDDIVVKNTDYGTREILGSVLQDLVQELGEDKKAYNFTKEELINDLNNNLGTDVVNKLLAGEIDFVQVVY